VYVDTPLKNKYRRCAVLSVRLGLPSALGNERMDRYCLAQFHHLRGRIGSLGLDALAGKVHRHRLNEL